jgi:hypothetical protein
MVICVIFSGVNDKEDVLFCLDSQTLCFGS